MNSEIQYELPSMTGMSFQCDQQRPKPQFRLADRLTQALGVDEGARRHDKTEGESGS